MSVIIDPDEVDCVCGYVLDFMMFLVYFWDNNHDIITMKGGVVLVRASAFSCLFMHLVITCCSRVHSAPFVALAIYKAFWNCVFYEMYLKCYLELR